MMSGSWVRYGVSYVGFVECDIRCFIAWLCHPVVILLSSHVPSDVLACCLMFIVVFYIGKAAAA